MDDFFLGLFAALLGLAIAFWGLRLFFIMLPLWGFIAGFFVGAEVFTIIFGDGFLSTVTGWVIGFFVGIIFAVLSYLFWYVGAVIAAGSVGATLGSGLMAAINVDTDWVVFVVSLIGAILLAYLAIVWALPVYMVIVSTGFLGATAVTVGVMLIFDVVDKEAFEWGSSFGMIEESWFWLLVWAVVAGVAIGYQLTSISKFALPENRWGRAQPAPAI